MKTLGNHHHLEILSNVPDTCMIVFDRELTIMEIIDRDACLEELIPGSSALGNIHDIADPVWKKNLMDVCENAIKGSPETRIMQLTSGQVKIRTLNLGEIGGGPAGVLMLQGNTGSQREYGDEMKKEKEEAEETSEIKSRFMARISHEIRTPLNAIIGFIEQLQKTPLNEKQVAYLKIIDKSSVYLLDLVNEILTFSKIESGELQLDEVDFRLESLFRDIYNTFRNRADEKGINFRYSFDEKLKKIFRGDAIRLKQIIINLVSNAIKFTEYGFVELKVTCLKDAGDEVWIKISVSDTGIGISEKKIRDVFTEYKQASVGIARLHGGTGLGLTISKRLTEMLSGEISVKSTEGKGSVFTVHIPLKKSKLKYLSTYTMHIDAEELSGKSALIVDDDAMNRSLGVIILEGFNMMVSMASDGKEAMEILRRKRFDVVLLDIHMPLVSGLDVARFIRNSEKNRDVKIIAVTAEMIREELEHCLEEGMDDYLIKPYREINLFNKLCKVLEVESGEIGGPPLEIRLIEFNAQPLFDLRELKTVTRQNKEFFNEMIETFIHNAERGVAQIRSAYEKKDWHTISETAHRLIPSYKHLGIKKVVSNLIELKSKTQHDPLPDNLSVLISKIERKTKEVTRRLEKEKL
ncbi:MAG TPA: response regulator [Bacteroides sp.]|nr:response regulator [Bacteroides sp.]